MKKFVIALLAATVLAAPMAQAQDWRNGPDRGRQVERHMDKKFQGNKNVHRNKKAAIQKHRWNKGHRMSAAERRQMREVRDYRRHRLSAPPRGHRWVQVDNDFLLVGITSGIIASIIASR